ncbi:HesA/MoeB/ThiF family protein [Hydrogenophaga sp. BPS33]|uniref:HesA/MoeB/ThiF family protein n=1 Tax=Hydrogenophaga sp. BPS33 TaxID=2651974 RepID=UPI00131F83FD|nr:molybdopterin-synthase adenylyltransferase MoeB [Hydrogenophaga sp. BPS33]QHE87904.1 molybdopterin-synthase adenylyltransferase MoeB [Hydrogenophaga sp. BPS33]
MDDAQLLRYSRHILLNELGVEGQEALLASHALVIGAGGLGSPVALYLGSAGVGRITVVDHDTVDVTNLQRQIAHNLARVGHAKAESVREAVAAINPDVVVTPVVQRADAALLDALVAQADVVLDCTDNFDTRHAINRACVAHRKPLVSGAAIRMDGQLSVYDSRTPGNPCYACVFPQDAGVEEALCATMGVFAPLVGLVGTMQAAEALKLLTGLGSRITGRLLMIDGRDLGFTSIALPQNPQCKVCSHPPAPLRGFPPL